MKILKTLSSVVLSAIALQLSSTAVFASSMLAENTAESASSTVVTASDIKWGYLNRLRGDKSPGAAELWGDRTQNVATGMLVKFNKGFYSPPHIHNVSYRGLVIDGLMHNDDPNAAEMWLPQGSFWTQPAGEDHITAASGQANLIYLEIDSGPYLVKPSKASFNNGEKPINVHTSNMVWLKGDDVAFVKPNSGVEVSPLWGSTIAGELGGTLVKLPADFSGELAVDADEFRVVVIKGSVQYQTAQLKSAQAKSVTDLTSGSYFYSKGTFSHQVTSSEQTIIYIRTNGRFTVR
ncbi:DUF4437 domain-containing protein [Algibacillus agarilyticus]|uniref:DUF4437 domain-containing protein n=1 Tax=Algibacillus agarilyticus TaxID=2234133 RepID=UPI000DD05793|nr:DUF4437 domain-containing protein [Algibacillus agarilyticus]